MDEQKKLSIECDFLKRFFLNRGKQLNLSRLLCQLNTGEISSKEFSSELDSNEDSYLVVLEDRELTEEETEVLVSLVSELKGEGVLDSTISVVEVGELLGINFMGNKNLNL